MTHVKPCKPVRGGTSTRTDAQAPRKTQFPNPALQNAVQLHSTRQTRPKTTLNCVSSTVSPHRGLAIAQHATSAGHRGDCADRLGGTHQIAYKSVYQVAQMMSRRQITTIRFLHDQKMTWRKRQLQPSHPVCPDRVASGHGTLAEALPQSPGKPGTELMHEHPIHVVTWWMGNTPAMRHYLQVTDADFDRAVRGGSRSVEAA